MQVRVRELWGCTPGCVREAKAVFPAVCFRGSALASENYLTVHRGKIFAP